MTEHTATRASKERADGGGDSAGNGRNGGGRDRRGRGWLRWAGFGLFGTLALAVVALLFARENPDRATGLALIAPSRIDYPDAMDWWLLGLPVVDEYWAPSSTPAVPGAGCQHRPTEIRIRGSLHPHQPSFRPHRVHPATLTACGQPRNFVGPRPA